MSNETGVPSGVSEALNNLLKHREERRARDREGLAREFGFTHRDDARRYFSLPSSPGSNWIRDKYLGAQEGPTWMSPKPNRLKRFGWYVVDRVLVPTLVVAAGILSAVAVLVGMKM